MILSDKELHSAIESGDLVIVGTNSAYVFDRTKQIQPSSIDLRLGCRFLRFNKSIDKFDIKTIDSILERITPYEYSDGDQITIRPGETIFGEIYEQLKLPSDASGFVVGRSRYARIGLSVHCTGAYINPDFEGAMPLQLTNHNTVPIIIYPYITICQICLLRLTSLPLIPYPKRTDNPFHREKHAGISPGVFEPDGNDNITKQSLQVIIEERLVSDYLKRLAADKIMSTSKRNVQTEGSIVIQGSNYAPINTGVAREISSEIRAIGGKPEQQFVSELLKIQEEIARNHQADDRERSEMSALIKELIKQTKTEKAQRPHTYILKTLVEALLDKAAKLMVDPNVIKALVDKAKAIFGF